MAAVGQCTCRASVVRRTAEGTAPAGEDTAAESVLRLQIRKEMIDDGGAEIVYVGTVVAELRRIFAVLPQRIVSFKVVLQ
jgi:hypothetical protein